MVYSISIYPVLPLTIYRCRKRVWSGTFFDGLSLPLVDVVSFLLCWVAGMKVTHLRQTVRAISQWSQPTTVEWREKAREAIHRSLIVQGNVAEKNYAHFILVSVQFRFYFLCSQL